MDMFINAASLFIKGKLFRDLSAVIRQQLIGAAIAFVLAVVLKKVGLPLWGAVIVASFISGALQPWLFKDLKYA